MVIFFVISAIFNSSGSGAAVLKIRPATSNPDGGNTGGNNPGGGSTGGDNTGSVNTGGNNNGSGNTGSDSNNSGGSNDTQGSANSPSAPALSTPAISNQAKQPAKPVADISDMKTPFTKDKGDRKGWSSMQGNFAGEGETLMADNDTNKESMEFASAETEDSEKGEKGKTAVDATANHKELPTSNQTSASKAVKGLTRNTGMLILILILLLIAGV
uniref:Uncharacterized protein n=1 Tax=uncultured prokaryote TaxID=198431 RepID=A0A0H5Q2J4_9ZZZZ|nr:hypothetical protein [uncultured prokaryote]